MKQRCDNGSIVFWYVTVCLCGCVGLTVRVIPDAAVAVRGARFLRAARAPRLAPALDPAHPRIRLETAERLRKIITIQFSSSLCSGRDFS